LSGSTISGNAATGGGGGISFLGTLSLTNSTVSGNTAGSAGGGGIFNGVESAVLTLVSSTVADNTAEGGASAIASDGAATLRSTVIAGDCAGAGSVASNGGNLESPGDTCELNPSAGDRVPVSADALDLGLLLDNGGPTRTHAPGQNSRAIDAIPTEDCLDAQGERLETDQRGVERPQGPACDAGAVEVD